MSADFDAGSIEASLDLNTKPFYAGLRKAQTQAERFEHGDAIEPDLGLDSSEFHREAAVAETRLRTLDAQKAEPRVGLSGVASTLLGIELIRNSLRKLALTSIKITALTALVAALGSLVAATGPAAVAITAFAGATVLALGGIVMALVPWGVAMSGAVKKLVEANAEGERLAGWAGKAQHSLKHLTEAWKRVQKAVEPGIFRVLNTAFTGLTRIIPRLVPLIDAVSRGMNKLLNRIFAVTDSRLFRKFLRELTVWSEAFLAGAGKGLADLFRAFMNLFIALQPVMSQFGNGILSMLDSFAKWSRALRTNEEEMDKLQRRISMAGDLMKAFGRAVKSLFEGFAETTAPAHRFLIAIFDLIADIDFKPMGRFFGIILDGMAGIIEHQAAAKILLGLAAAAAMFFGGPIVAILGIVTAVALLGDALKDLGARFGISGKDVDGWGDRLKKAITDFWRFIQPGVERIRASLDRMMEFFVEAAPKIAKFGREIWAILAPGLRDLADVLFNEVIPAFVEFGEWILTKVVPIIADTLAPILKELARIFTENLVPVFIEFWDAVKPVIPTLMLLGEWILKIGGFILKHLVPPLLRVTTAVGKVIALIGIGFIGALVDAILWVGKMGRKIEELARIARVGINTIKAKFDEMGASARVARDRVKARFNELVRFFRNLPGRIASAVRGMFMAVVREALSAFDGVVKAWNRTVGRLPGMPGGGGGGGVSGGGLGGALSGGVRGLASGIGKLDPRGWFAEGGVTRGPAVVGVGDNVGGQEAIVPLNKYEIPRKGDLEALRRRAEDTDRQLISLLAALLAKPGDLDVSELAELIGEAISKHTKATMRDMVRVARAGG